MTYIWRMARRSSGDAGGAKCRSAQIAVCLLAIGLLGVLALPGGAAAAVWTDQSSYAPGSTVTISGDNGDAAGYAAGEAVNVAVNQPSGPGVSCGATTDEFGAWSCQISLASDSSAVGLYSYTATGETSGVSQGGSFADSGCS